MNENAIIIAEEFISGDYENDIKQASKAIGDLENLLPDFVTLEKMLQSKYNSSLEAALYILYNKGGKFPPSILKIIENLVSHPSNEIRLWAKSCLD